MAKAPISKCALCEEVKTLRDSHLLPKAAYRHVRDDPLSQGGSPLRVHVAEKEAFYTDMQVKKYLLCNECEQIFTKYGESIVSRCWATKQGFPLLEHLEDNARLGVGEKAIAYNTNNIQSDLLEAIYYFGASVIWRSSRWDWGRRKSPHFNSLGTHYDKIFREYLLRRTNGMEGVRLFLVVNTNPELNGVMFFPCCGRDRVSRHHRFSILGLHFSYIVGSACCKEVDMLCKVFNSSVVVAGADYAQSKEIYNIAREFQKIELPIRL